MSRRVVVAWAAVFGVALTAACGSTVQVSRQQTAAVGGVAGSGLPGGSGLDGPAGTALPTTGRSASAGNRGSTDATGGGASGGASAAPPTTGHGVVVAPRAGGPSGPGVSPDSLVLGFEYYGDNSFGEQTGTDTFGNPQPKVYADAVVRYLNARGGVAGRRVSLVTATYGSNDTPAQEVQESQAACSTFTEDHHVFAVVSQFDHVASPNYLPCLAGKDTVLVSTGGSPPPASDLVRFPAHLYTPSAMNLTRAARVYGAELARTGFLTPQHRIGLLRLDDPAWKAAADDGLKPALQAAGLQLVRETAAAYDASSGPAQISAAVLGFKSAGIDRVLFLVPNGLGPLFFVRAASAQDYHPKYGFSSFDEVAAQADLLPAKELEGSAGVGWRQLLDVGDTAPAHTASYRSCLSIMRSAGLRLDGLSAVFSALQACDGLLVLATALGPATGPLRSGVLRERIDALSSSYSSPLTLATRFAGDRHDAAAAVRDFRYDPGCGCFAYTGPPRAS